MDRVDHWSGNAKLAARSGRGKLKLGRGIYVGYRSDGFGAGRGGEQADVQLKGKRRKEAQKLEKITGCLEARPGSSPGRLGASRVFPFEHAADR